MYNESFFLSLKWKLAILFGSFFLVLLTAFSFFSYFNDKENFEKYRSQIQANHVNILTALTKDSFTVMEQLAELISFINPPTPNSAVDLQKAVSSVEDRWTRWQLIWDIQNVTFFSKDGKIVKAWGQPVTSFGSGLQTVLQKEMPETRIICLDKCFQQILVPLLGESELIGVLSLTRSFTDVMIKFKSATRVDMALLNGRRQNKNNTAILIEGKKGAYQVSALTNPATNSQVMLHLSQHYRLEQLYGKSVRIEFNNAVYEVAALPAEQQFNVESGEVIYLFIDNITQDLSQLNANLKKIWLSGVWGLIGVLTLTGFLLHLFFRRISSLSKALPLLAVNKFSEFRSQIALASPAALGYDEIDGLSQTALLLSDQLESLEQKMHGHTFSLLEKTKKLANERDFIRQLIDLAPIIIIIQKLNGIILSINHAGKEALETDNSIIGKVFDLFIPESEQEHLIKLNRLRTHHGPEQIEQDGQLVAESGKIFEVSWLHKLLPFKDEGEEQLILTLGIDISERKIAEARNIRMAYFDYLTGLGNRRKFYEEFMQQIAAAERYNYQLALLYLDLDRFKEINDTSGHEAGDNFLKLVANTLKSAIRSTDLLCRLGGDEFILLMPHADDPKGIEQIASKINAVLKSQIFTCSGKSFVPSASIGVAIYPGHGTTINDLMANADLAMYRAKELGRAQHHLFDPAYDYRSKSNQMVHWRGVLEDAIKNDRFILLYQPILNIKTNQISHYECLLRLQQADGQVLLPSEFVHRAEELGLIGKIDRIVLKKALLQHMEFNRQGKNFQLTINVSRRTFDDPSIFEDFRDLFQNPKVNREKIIFEVTDNAAAANFESTGELINRIKDLGCVLALNDFGIEYPSLQYLKNAPVDYVKIDGSLIRQIDKNQEDKAFVKALCEVAKAFGKKTVAEFVENEDILDILKEFGIDYAQGYHIGWPAALDKKQ